MRDLIEKVVNSLSYRCRRKRAELFLRYLRPTEGDKILDLGSEDGRLIASVVPFRKNVLLADIDEEMLAKARSRYGFETILLDGSDVLPFEDSYFDIVHCSSVIEHVTGYGAAQCSPESAGEFARLAFERQKRFAAEIRRISKNYFVQTSNKNFVLETHSWLPGVQFLPRRLLVKTVMFTNRWWCKRTLPNWNLLTQRQMKQLFPDAMILKERIMGMTKSIMAIGGNRANAGKTQARTRPGRSFVR